MNLLLLSFSCACCLSVFCVFLSCSDLLFSSFYNEDCFICTFLHLFFPFFFLSLSLFLIESIYTRHERDSGSLMETLANFAFHFFPSSSCSLTHMRHFISSFLFIFHRQQWDTLSFFVMIPYPYYCGDDSNKIIIYSLSPVQSWFESVCLSSSLSSGISFVDPQERKESPAASILASGFTLT